MKEDNRRETGDGTSQTEAGIHPRAGCLRAAHFYSAAGEKFDEHRKMFSVQ
jgi:hypothetical protein